MSLFDYVNFTMDCPTCGAKQGYFQTKDTECPYMETVEFWQVDRFYTWCDKCGTSVDFILKRPEKPTIDDYRMIVETKEAREARWAEERERGERR